MTAAVHSLHQAYPGKYVTAVRSCAPQLFEHNPDVVPEEALPAGFNTIKMNYPLVNQSNQRAIHFMEAYCSYLGEALKVPLPLMTSRPLVYLSRQEREWLPQVQEVTGRPTRYWVVNAGHKDDYPAKWWGRQAFQRVVDLLRGRVLFVQVGQSGHNHPELDGVLNLVGKTDHRQLVRLVYHTRGVLTGLSYLHHLAAAVERPSVTLSGGREPINWNAYPLAHLLHTMGALDCCRTQACWCSRVEPAEGHTCCKDVWPGSEKVPRCLAMITPESVAEKILQLS